ncbi:MAG: cytochrome c1 [Marinicaulis sp.]|nr:cytochrome c1 [Marinicaulis sp.]
MKNFSRILTATLFTAFASVGVADAAGGKAKKLEHQHWHFSGPFGKFDQDAMQRGYQVYETVCSNCHGLEYLSFRHLGQKGGPFYLDKCPAGIPDNIDCSNPNDNPVVKAIAANYKFQVTDGPDDSGDMFQRPALPSDRFPGPFANEQIARLANNNALPPDLSLITKARHSGPDYLYALLTGYEDTPDTVEIAAGQYYNPYFPGDMTQNMKPEFMDHGHAIEGVDVPLGGVLSMAPPLSDGMIEYTDGSPMTVEQYSKDVTEFLMWAAEPKMEARKSLGVVSLIYLVILAGLLYWSCRKVWSNVDH